MVRAVNQRILGLISHIIQRFDDFLNDIVAAEIEDVWDVFHEQREGLQAFNILEITKIEIGARVDFERLWVFCDFTQLRPTDARICLARWSTNNDIECIRGATKFEIGHKLLWVNPYDVAWLSMVLNLCFGAVLEEI